MSKKKIFIIFLGLIMVLSLTVLATAYNEAPMLKEQVETGNLPSVEERLPLDPYVVEPRDEIGQYGGTVRVAADIPEGWGDDTQIMGSYTPGIVVPSNEDFSPRLNFLKNVDVSDDAIEYTLHLYEGLKWSDGHPYTADDIMFWYEDMLLNEELTPVIPEVYSSRNEEGEKEVVDVKKIDQYTVKFEFTSPQPYFLTNALYQFWAHVNPKHYLKQFHPNYVSEDKLKEMAEEEGYDDWYQLFEDKNSGHSGLKWDLECPSIAPYVLEQIDSSQRIWVRNPYYWKVDTAGNQLPYIDRIKCNMVADSEVVQGMIISGEVDFSAWFTEATKYPMYKRYEDAGNYQVVMNDDALGAAIHFHVNMTHENPEKREIFQNVKFRQALSLALDRDEINEAIYFGQAVPRQYTVLESSKYFEPEFAEAYVDYKPEEANKLLDEIGLDRKDDSGYRLRPDGQKLTIVFESSSHNQKYLPLVELVMEQWRENLGLDVKYRFRSPELMQQRVPANKLDAEFWKGNNVLDTLFPTQALWFVPYPPPGWERTLWVEWQKWFGTDGEKGEDPPAEIKDLYHWWLEMMNEPDEERRIELGKKIVSKQAENLWHIGTVGYPPYPTIFSRNLGNVPGPQLVAWDNLWYCGDEMEQLYFKE